MMSDQKSDKMEAIKENDTMNLVGGGGDNESSERRQNNGLQTSRDEDKNNGFAENEEQLGEAANTGGNPETSSSAYGNEEEAGNEMEDDEVNAGGSSMEDNMMAGKTDDKQQGLNLRKNGRSRSARGAGRRKQSSHPRPQWPRRSSPRQVIARRLVAARRQSEPRHVQNKRMRMQSPQQGNDDGKMATRSSKRISNSTKGKHDSSEEDEDTANGRRQENEGEYGCRYCAAIFQTFNQLCEHRHVAHNPSEAVEGVFRCPFFCGVPLFTIDDLNIHVQNTHQLPNFKCFGCRKCGTIFRHQKALDEHSANAH